MLKKKLKYDLTALVEHVGYSPSNGHFLAYKKFLESMKSSLWVRANDDRVELVNR